YYPGYNPYYNGLYNPPNTQVNVTVAPTSPTPPADNGNGAPPLRPLPRVQEYDGDGKPIPPPARPEAAEDRARITVVVPADAEVWVDGTKTSQQGTDREFVSPPLKSGQRFRYDVMARWRDGGRTVEQTRTVRFESGDKLTVDFTKSGKPETLTM